jgi:hypothetical protein
MNFLGALRIPFLSFQFLRRPGRTAKLLCFHTIGGFDPHRPYQKSAKFTLIRLHLLTSHPSICAQMTGVLRPFCAQILSEPHVEFLREK